MGKNNNRKKNARRKKTTKSSSSSAAKIDTKTVDDSTNVEDKATNEVEVKEASKDATSTDTKTNNGEATATTSTSPMKPSRTKSVLSSVGSMITSPFSTVSGEFSFVVFFVHHNAQRAYTHLLTPLLL